MGEKKSIYLADNILKIIGPTDPGELSSRIADIIDRYGVLCQLERKALEEIFSGVTDLDSLADAVWNTVWRPASTLINGVLADFQDSGPDGLYEKWGVDPQTIIEKLRGLNYGQQIALGELLERRKRRMAGENE